MHVKRSLTVAHFLRPNVLIPLAFGLALVFGVLALGDVRRVGRAIASIDHAALAIAVLLLLLYLAMRGAQWYLFLCVMHVPLTPRQAAVAFAGGEATESLPVGVYFANYLLERETSAPIAYTAAATLVGILLEVACCCLYLAVVGIPTWSWLRPLIIGGLAVFVGLLGIWNVVGRRLRLPRAMAMHPRAHWLANQVHYFAVGARRLRAPRVLLAGFALSTVALAASGSAYAILLRGVGAGGVSYWYAIAAYLFGLGSGLILPTPTELGVSELTGLGALRAAGAPVTEAAATVLLFRLLLMGTVILAALVTFLVMRHEVAMLFGPPALSRAGRAVNAPERTARRPRGHRRRSWPPKGACPRSR
jgi:uncharacterized membrane protein YbhN (UPF0104 family)